MNTTCKHYNEQSFAGIIKTDSTFVCMFCRVEELEAKLAWVERQRDDQQESLLFQLETERVTHEATVSRAAKLATEIIEKDIDIRQLQEKIADIWIHLANECNCNTWRECVFEARKIAFQTLRKSNKLCSICGGTGKRHPMEDYPGDISPSGTGNYTCKNCSGTGLTEP